MERVERDLEELEAERLETERLTLNFGPSHPATHGTLRLVMELEGETVVKVTPEIGYLHTGFEKLGEYRSYNQFITLTDRMNYLSPLNNNIGFALAVEKLLGITVPPRCQVIRVILAELSRISDHLLCVGFQALDLGAFTVFLYTFRERERLYEIFEAVCGSRLTTSYTRVGGLMRDVPDDFEAMVGHFCKTFPKTLDEIEALLNRNRIWLERTQGVGVITEQDVYDYSLSGPIARGSGVPRDIRRTEPYLNYEEYDFDIPVGQHGDVYDRYLVRMEEMKQSIRICEQALAKGLPKGPVNVDDPKIVLPPKQAVYHQMEAMIHHFEIMMQNRGFGPPEGEVYMATEAPNGELGFYVVSDGKREPYRIRVRPPSFINYTIFGKLLEGRMLSDTVAILGSLNIIAGELDR